MICVVCLRSTLICMHTTYYMYIIWNDIQFNVSKTFINMWKRYIVHIHSLYFGFILCTAYKVGLSSLLKLTISEHVLKYAFILYVYEEMEKMLSSIYSYRFLLGFFLLLNGNIHSMLNKLLYSVASK